MHEIPRQRDRKIEIIDEGNKDSIDSFHGRSLLNIFKEFSFVSVMELRVNK